MLVSLFFVFGVFLYLTGQIVFAESVIPTPWVLEDKKDPTKQINLPDEVSYADGVYDVNTDYFNFIYQRLDYCNGETVVRVLSIDPPIQTTTSTRSIPLLFMTETFPQDNSLLFQNRNLEIQIREQATSLRLNAVSTTTPGSVNDKYVNIPKNFPVWLKITRQFNNFSAFYSLDGTAWLNLVNININMARPFYVGFLNRAIDNPQNKLLGSQFDNLSAVQSDASCVPSPSPYTVLDLKTLLMNYLNKDDRLYTPFDAKVNMLDAGYVISLIMP